MPPRGMFEAPGIFRKTVIPAVSQFHGKYVLSPEKIRYVITVIINRSVITGDFGSQGEIAYLFSIQVGPVVSQAADIQISPGSRIFQGESFSEQRFRIGDVGQNVWFYPFRRDP